MRRVRSPSRNRTALASYGYRHGRCDPPSPVRQHYVKLIFAIREYICHMARILKPT